MGGMIAAEMACLNPRELDRLVLVGAAGLWIDDHPIPDVFAALPHELAELLFVDADRGMALLTGGADFGDLEALREFFIGNARRLGTAGKLLFPVPSRRVTKRLYRISAETLVLWGAQDRLMPPVYAERWGALIRQARVSVLDGAGHMLPYEAPERFADAVVGFLG